MASPSMVAAGARAVAAALVAATLAAACGDDGEGADPAYGSAQQLADALGCGDSFELDRLPEDDPNDLVVVASTGPRVEVGSCELANSRVLLRVTDVVGTDDEVGAAFEAFWCLGEPTDSADLHYAEGRGWIAVPADPRDRERASELAELLDGRVAGFGCAE